MAATSIAEAHTHLTRKTRLVILVFCTGLILALSGCGGSGVFGTGGVDFALSVTPGSQIVTAGNLLTYDINITQISGVGSLVQLNASGLPVGVSARFSDPTVSSPGTSHLAILTPTNMQPESFQFTITGSDFSGSQTTQAMMTINPGPPPIDFVIDVTPATQTTLGGGSVNYKVNVSSDNAAPVNLSVTGLPTGATGTFNPPSITGTGSSTLTVATQNPTSPAFYGLNVIASDPTGTQKVPIVLNIPVVDFTLEQHVGPSDVTAGGDIIGTVTATPVLGALQPVTLSVSGLPPGASVTLNPATLGGAVTSSTMTIHTTTSLAQGVYPLTVGAQDASGTQSADVAFTAVSGNPSAGFFLAAIPDQVEVPAGGGATSTIIVSNNGGPVLPLTFSVSGGGDVSASLSPAGPNVFQLTISTSPQSTQSVGVVVVTATGPSGTQQIEVTVQVDQIN